MDSVTLIEQLQEILSNSANQLTIGSKSVIESMIRGLYVGNRKRLINNICKEKIDILLQVFYDTYLVDSNILSNDSKQIFIASILIVFCPEFISDPCARRLPDGVCPSIARSLQMSTSRISEICHDVRIYCRVYEDFQQKTTDFIAEIKKSPKTESIFGESRP